MAEYTFGQNILRYIQNQDELNLRAKQMQTEEERYKAQQSFNERQAQLTGARWQADYNLKIAKEIADQENAFNKENTILNALPEDIRKQIPTEAYKYKNENIYVPNEVVTNLEQGNQRMLELEKERFDQLNAEEQRKISQQNANTSVGNLNETIRYHDYLMSKETTDKQRLANEKTYKDSISLASDYLTKLKVFHNSGGESNLKDKDYATYKGSGIKAVEDALSSVGITPATTIAIEKDGKQGEVSLYDFIRQGGALSNAEKLKFSVLENKAKEDEDFAKKNEWAQAKRNYYNKAIYSIEGYLTYQQLEALKLRNEIGTR